MDNVDFYMTAEDLATRYPNDELSIEFEKLNSGIKYTDTPEKLAAAKALIAKYDKSKK